MDFKNNFFALALLCIFLSFDYVNSLQCYVCTTKVEEEEDCLVIPEGSTRFLQNCTSPKNETCRTQVQWIDFDLMDLTRDRHIIRRCSSSVYDASQPCFYRTGNLGRMSVCSCESDGCNKATRSVTVVFSTIAACLLLVISISVHSKLL